MQILQFQYLNWDDHDETLTVGALYIYHSMTNQKENIYKEMLNTWCETILHQHQVQNY